MKIILVIYKCAYSTLTHKLFVDRFKNRSFLFLYLYYANPYTVCRSVSKPIFFIGIIKNIKQIYQNIAII